MGGTGRRSAAHNLELGKRGEEAAAEYLREKGFEILERNSTFLQGEIDIVARDGGTLVFCEVKTREDDEFGLPEYAITGAKQRQMRRAAAAYLFERSIDDAECRFDVVAVTLAGDVREVVHYPNAFYL